MGAVDGSVRSQVGLLAQRPMAAAARGPLARRAYAPRQSAAAGRSPSPAAATAIPQRVAVRYGVLADIHANLPALETAIQTLESHGIDAYIVAGDLVGYGPHPNECVELVAGLDAVCVAGNHDLIVLGQLSDQRCIELARASLRWTSRVLGGDARAFLGALPLRASISAGVEVAHGSLHDPQEYTVGEKRASRQLALLRTERPDAAVLVLGHTHRPFAFALDQGRLRARASTPLRIAPETPVLLNPGGVGQSRELRPRVRCMVLDLEAHEARFLAVPYDIAACRRALRQVGLSPASCHLRPSPLRAATRITRAARRRATAAARRWQRR
jgi:predicted phosphodiesterase